MIQSFDRNLEKTDSFETNYIKVLYYDLAQDYKEIYKSYQYNRLCTITEGTKRVKINNGREFEYNKSEFILLPPNSSVQMEIKEATKAVVYEISDKLIEDTCNHLQNKYDQEIMDPKSSIVTQKLQPAIFEPIQRINSHCTSRNPGKEFLVDLCAQELAYNLIQGFLITPSGTGIPQDPVDYAIDYLKKNLSQNITIHEIASQLNMSASNLSSLFKKKTGTTPKEYQNLLKLKASKEELKHKNVTEVCFDLGFENVSYFIRMFKNYYGETPKQYALKMASLSV